MDRVKILVLVEGAKIDVRLMEHLFRVYGIEAKYDIVSYNTNVYVLYNDYPMVEAFYHMGNIPDSDYIERTATLDELRGHTYKQRVNLENRDHSYSKFAVTREECSTVIWQNIEKGWHILPDNPDGLLPNSIKMLNRQLDTLKGYEKIYVLCTYVFYIAEYNPKLLTIGR